MATVVDEELPETHSREWKYPWAQWTDGRTWFLVRGEDFTCTTQSMDSGVRQAARSRGLRAKVRRVGDDLVIQAVRPGTKAA